MLHTSCFDTLAIQPGLSSSVKGTKTEREDPKKNKMAPTSGEILILGEQLRLRMHQEPSMIKDRRYHFRTYSCCFVGKDSIDWMVKYREATSRANAMKCMRLLQDNGVLHHGMFDMKDLAFHFSFHFILFLKLNLQN